MKKLQFDFRYKTVDMTSSSPKLRIGNECDIYPDW